MNTTEITLIVARAENGVIGRDGALPWHLPADLKHFKALTLGTPMIMGRRTFESLPGLLPGRRHIVLTRDPAWRRDGAETARTPDEALALAGAVPAVSVIGGAAIFDLFLPHATRIVLTEVHAAPAGDTVMPDPRGPGWTEIGRVPHAAEAGRPAFSFVELVRRCDAAGRTDAPHVDASHEESAMNADKPHHPLPADERARHDLLPEGLETTRDAGEDDPEAPAPGATQAPDLHFRNPDGSPYDA